MKETFFNLFLARVSPEETLKEQSENIKVQKMVLKMFKMGMDINTISQATELMLAAVEKMIKEESSKDK